MAQNVRMGFMVTAVPSKSFGKGLNHLDVMVLLLALLFLDWGVKFVSLLEIPAPAMTREN